MGDYRAIRQELELFNPALAAKPQVRVLWWRLVGRRDSEASLAACLPCGQAALHCCCLHCWLTFPSPYPSTPLLSPPLPSRLWPTTRWTSPTRPTTGRTSGTRWPPGACPPTTSSPSGARGWQSGAGSFPACWLATLLLPRPPLANTACLTPLSHLSHYFCPQRGERARRDGAGARRARRARRHAERGGGGGGRGGGARAEHGGGAGAARAARHGCKDWRVYDRGRPGGAARLGRPRACRSLPAWPCEPLGQSRARAACKDGAACRHGSLTPRCAPPLPTGLCLLFLFLCRAWPSSALRR